MSKKTIEQLEELIRHSADYTDSVYFDTQEVGDDLYVTIQVPTRGGRSIVAEGKSAKEAIMLAHIRLKKGVGSTDE